MDKPSAILCDLDGTLAITGQRNIYDDMKCYADTVNGPVLETIKALMRHGTHKLVFMSGRQNRCRQETVRWLKNKVGFTRLVYELFMRNTGDNRPDDVVKEPLYRTFVEPEYEVFLAFDDRDRIVKLWRRLGLTCFQVAEGSF